MLNNPTLDIYEEQQKIPDPALISKEINNSTKYNKLDKVMMSANSDILDTNDIKNENAHTNDKNVYFGSFSTPVAIE